MKPSAVQTFAHGGHVTITGLGRASTYEDMTLGRAEIGGRYAITSSLSAFGFSSYAFGRDYSASAFGAGFNISW